MGESEMLNMFDKWFAHVIPRCKIGAPRHCVNLVNAHRLLAGQYSSAISHPFVIRPFEWNIITGNDRCVSGWKFTASRHRVGFHDLSPVGSRYTKFVELPWHRAVDDSCPHTRGFDGVQFIATPPVPVTQDLYPLRIRRPNCEPHTVFCSLWAKHFPKATVSALVEEVKIEFARHRVDKSGVSHP